jgi:hypothetical protein
MTIDSLVNLDEIARQELKQDAELALLQAILGKLEEINQRLQSFGK